MLTQTASLFLRGRLAKRPFPWCMFLSSNTEDILRPFFCTPCRATEDPSVAIKDLRVSAVKMFGSERSHSAEQGRERDRVDVARSASRSGREGPDETALGPFATFLLQRCEGRSFQVYLPHVLACMVYFLSFHFPSLTLSIFVLQMEEQLACGPLVINFSKSGF